jgi:hypothetical protein
MPTPPASQPPTLKDLIAAEPDLVDRIFDYILAEFPQIACQPPDKIATTKAAPIMAKLVGILKK